jgi:DNA-binding response OmpR family regulator
MARILLLEDDPVLGKGLQVHLQATGFEVTWFTHLAEARRQALADAFDLLLLDVNLPDGTGFDFCRELRVQGSTLPVVMLTARADEDSVVTGFDSGANDYVRKPFSNRELVARIQTHLKERGAREGEIRLGPIRVLPDQRRVLVDGVDLGLNRREFEIFSCLIRVPGGVLTREQLIDALSTADNILDRTIDSHFSHIRTKLKKNAVNSVLIRAVYGVGYKLELC